MISGRTGCSACRNDRADQEQNPQYYQYYQTYRNVSVSICNIEKRTIANPARHTGKKSDRSTSNEEEPNPESPIPGYIAARHQWLGAFAGLAWDSAGASLLLRRLGRTTGAGPLSLHSPMDLRGLQGLVRRGL